MIARRLGGWAAARARVSAVALGTLLSACGGSPHAVGPAEPVPKPTDSPRQAVIATDGPHKATETCGLPDLVPTLPGSMASERASGVAALDEGRLGDARQALTRVLEAHPGNAATQALYDGLERAVATAQREASVAVGKLPIHMIDQPPLGHRVFRAVASSPRGPVPSLGGMRSKPNKIVDEEAWLADNDLTFPRRSQPARVSGIVVPMTLDGLGVSDVIDHGDHLVLVHGERVVTVVAEDGAVIGVYDLTAFLNIAGMSQAVRWAEARDGVLYVANANLGYARDAGGHNAYLSAIDLQSGDLLWRSHPLVANSRNFIVHGSYLLSGYGFTAEPDYLYVIARDTGETVKRLPLSTKPDILVAKDGQLFVRGYNRDFVFDLPSPTEAPTGPMAGRAAATPLTLKSAAFARPLEPTPDDRCLRDGALLLLDHAEGPGATIDEAASRLWRLSPAFKRSEPTAALRQLVSEVQAGRRWLAQGPVHRPDAPPDRHATGDAAHPPLAEAPPPQLVQRSATRNAITDRRRWLLDHGAAFPQRPRTAEDARRRVGGFAVPGAPLPQVPERFGLSELTRVIDHGDHQALIYGGRFLVLMAGGLHQTTLDLGSFVEPAAVRDSEWAEFADQDVTWAERADGVIYLCNGGGSYAKEVYGKKGYLSALDAQGRLVWRSDPLVCNANFVLRGRYLITGYGFTSEPDHLFVIDRMTGETVSSTTLASAPEILVVEDDRLLLRTYDTNYVFDLR